MMMLEYMVCLFTFVAIQYVGIEVGMLLGVLGAMANFVYSYAKKSNVTVTALRFSSAVRTFEVRSVGASFVDVLDWFASVACFVMCLYLTLCEQSSIIGASHPGGQQREDCDHFVGGVRVLWECSEVIGRGEAPCGDQHAVGGRACSWRGASSRVHRDVSPADS